MAIAYDAETAIPSGTGTRSVDHTPVGTPAGVVVVLSGGAVDETSGVTYGGVAMERKYTAANTAGESGTTSCWFLNQPLSGTRAVEVTRSGTTAYIGAIYTVTSSTGYSQVLTGDTYISTNTSSAGFTLTLDSSANFIVGGIYSGENALASITANPTNWTTLVQSDFGNFVSRVGRISVINTGASQDFTFTQSSDDAAVAAIVVKEASAPPATSMKDIIQLGIIAAPR